METTQKTKLCPSCGIEKPASKFYSNYNTEDGLSTQCRSCSAANRRGGKHKGLNPDLAAFQPRELIAELRARGYKGELKYTQTITL